jgi:hypothetical protein
LVRASGRSWRGQSATSWAEFKPVRPILSKPTAAEAREWSSAASHRFRQAPPARRNLRFTARRAARPVGGGAGGAGGAVLGGDQFLFGLALVLFGGTQRFARAFALFLGGGVFRKALGPFGAGLFRFLFQGGEAIALRQAYGRNRRRVGAGDKTIPAPHIAARRNQPLAGLELALQIGALVREYQARHGEAGVPVPAAP